MSAATIAQEPAYTSSTSGHRYPSVIFHTAGSEIEDVHVISLDLRTWSRTAAGPPRIPSAVRTSSGPAFEATTQTGQTAGQAVLEIRRRVGLTWEMLGRLFNVPRPTLDQWLCGGTPTTQCERETIQRTLDAVRHIDEGEQRVTQDRLLSAKKGPSPFDLIASHQHEKVLSQPKGTVATSAPKRTAMSEDERERRRPPPPALLLNALQDRPEVPVGKTRIAHSVARKKNLGE